MRLEVMGVKLVDRHDEIVRMLRQACADGANAAGQYFTDEAQSNARVNTGFMMTHIGITKPATVQDLTCVVRSLAPYSQAQNDGRHGNLFWTRAWLATRSRYKDFFGGRGIGVLTSMSNRDVQPAVRAAQQDFKHSFTDQGLKVTKVRTFGGGFAVRGSGGRFAGSYGGRH